MKMAAPIGMCLKRKTILVWVKEYINKNLWIIYCVQRKTPKCKLLDSENSVPWDPNGVFWLAQKWLILFAFAALIKMLCC